MGNRLGQRRKTLFLSLLTLFVFCARILMLFRSIYPNGMDGAFYAMEFKSIMERGHLENPSYSPIFWLGGGVSLLVGNAIWGVKICSALLSSLLVLSTYTLITSLYPRERFRSLFGALLVGLSPTLTTMSINYLNQMGGLAFCLFALALWNKVLVKISPWALMGALALSVLAILTHRVSAVYLFLFLAFLVGQRMRWDNLLRGKLWTKIGLLILALLLVFLVQKTFNQHDLDRFKGTFSLSPILPLFSPFLRQVLPLSVLVEMSLYFCLSYVLLLLSFILKKSKALFLLVPLIFFPFWDLSQLDMGYRLFLSSIPWAVIFLVSALPAHPLKNIMTQWYLSFFMVPLIFITILVYRPHRDPPYGKYLRVIESVNLDQNSLLIAHLGLNHIYTYEKDFKDALNYLPEFAIPPSQLWRLAYKVPLRTLEQKYPTQVQEGLIRSLPYDYILIREDLWQEYLLWEDEIIVSSLRNWYNPYIERPAFIRE